jgi:predicted nucleic acid-binding protein
MAKEMGYAVIGTLGVEQVAIIQCLVVKVGKVCVAVRMVIE